VPRQVIARAALAGALLVGCALPRKPIELRVASAGDVPARIEVRHEGGASPLECRAPCVVKLMPRAEVELTLSAEGYLPVVLPLVHSTLWSAGERIDLVLPLIEKGD